MRRTRVSYLPRSSMPPRAGFALPAPYSTRVPGLLEAGILRGVLSVLTLRRVWHRRIEVQGVLTHKHERTFLRPSRMQGLPDVIAIVGGRMWGLEAKAPGGRLSALQAEALAGIRDAGGVALVVVDPSRLGEVLAGRRSTADLPTCAGIPVA